MFVTLNLSSTILNEWQVRCIGEVIPQLADVTYADKMTVSEECCKEIAADCEFYLDPNGPETTVGERSAYRSLLKQCKAALQP